jgi:hypothetical protein
MIAVSTGNFPPLRALRDGAVFGSLLLVPVY